MLGTRLGFVRVGEQPASVKRQTERRGKVRTRSNQNHRRATIHNPRAPRLQHLRGSISIRDRLVHAPIRARRPSLRQRRISQIARVQRGVGAPECEHARDVLDVGRVEEAKGGVRDGVCGCEVVDHGGDGACGVGGRAWGVLFISMKSAGGDGEKPERGTYRA